MCDERKRKDDRAGREIDRKQDEGGRAVRERDTGEIKRHWNEVERGKELVGNERGEASERENPRPRGRSVGIKRRAEEKADLRYYRESGRARRKGSED